jgi:signal transduction histidine kinase
MALVAAFVAAVGVGVLATAGLAEIERRLIDDRLNTIIGQTEEWLAAPHGLGVGDGATFDGFDLDLPAAEVAAQLATRGSTLRLVLEEFGLDANDPIAIAVDSELAALVSGGEVTTVPVESVEGTMIELGLLYELSGPIPGLRADIPSRDELALATIPLGANSVVVGTYVGDIMDLADQMSRWAIVWAPAVVLGVFAMAWLLTGRALHPVGTMTGRVAAITPEAARSGERVPVPQARDELATLAEQYNELIDRIVDGDLRQRRFTADAGHELRSPLAVIRSESEQALTPGTSISREELAETVHAETLRMQELVDDLLALAQGDETSSPTRQEPVDVDDLILAEARRQRSAAIDISAVGAGRTSGDPELLARAFRHVIDNAVRHANGHVAISLRVEGGLVVVRIDDDGAGVPLQDRDRIFERFVRLDEARSRDLGGAGLGLAVTARIVRSHGGNVTIEDSHLGGARFVIALPVIAHAH